MSDHQSPTFDADWWPSTFSGSAFLGLFAGDTVQLGRLEFGDDRFHLTIVGVLLDDAELAAAKAIAGRFDHEFHVAAPDWPSTDEGPFEPRSTFHLPGVGPVETLVTVLSRSQWDYVYPSFEFLTTYGLMPESGSAETGLTLMCPTGPRSNVVQVGPASHRAGWSERSTAVSYVSANREFLQDYCSLRQKHFVVAYFLHAHELLTQLTDDFLGQERGWKSVERPGRHVALYPLSVGDKDLVKAEIWGIHGPIVSPGPRPVSDDDWEYSDFEWPAGTGLVKDGFVDNVFVRDLVLDRYLQEQDHFDINLISGAVSLGYQWSVITSGRRGRDVIEVDLKRLNEGVRRSVAQHWHQHAVQAPSIDVWDVLNIAERTAHILSAMHRLSKALSRLVSDVSVEAILPPDLLAAGVNGEEWPRALLAAGAPAPIDMDQQSFLRRGQALYDATVALIAEGRFVESLGNLPQKLLCCPTSSR